MSNEQNSRRAFIKHSGKAGIAAGLSSTVFAIVLQIRLPKLKSVAAYALRTVAIAVCVWCAGTGDRRANNGIALYQACRRLCQKFKRSLRCRKCKYAKPHRSSNCCRAFPNIPPKCATMRVVITTTNCSGNTCSHQRPPPCHRGNYWLPSRKIFLRLLPLKIHSMMRQKTGLAVAGHGSL